MRRCVLTLAVLAGLVLPAAAGAATSAGSSPREQLVGFTCHQAMDPANRSVAVKAIMRPLAGTQALQLRFALLVRRPGSGSFTAVHAGDLGRWLSPANPTLGQNPEDVWIFRKSVVELGAPAVYRYQVSFRWLGSGGSVLGTVVQYSPRCRQRELRPDLAVLAPIAVAPVGGQPDEDAYTATIADEGNSGAGPFEVEFVPGDGSAVQTQTVAWLPAHQVVSVSFVGPACESATPPTIIADSTLEVDDLNRANDTATAVCPAAGSPPAQGAPPSS